MAWCSYKVVVIDHLVQKIKPSLQHTHKHTEQNGVVCLHLISDFFNDHSKAITKKWQKQHNFLTFHWLSKPTSLTICRANVSYFYDIHFAKDNKLSNKWMSSSCHQSYLLNCHRYFLFSSDKSNHILLSKQVAISTLLLQMLWWWHHQSICSNKVDI